MNEITRKPAFWIAFAVVSALSAAFAWRYFPAALPMVNLDVKMTRGEALAQAAAIADRLDLAPPGAQSAVLFAHDGATQNFVELDAGGKPAFAAMIAGKLYSPYWWEVRLFKPGETAEAHVRFRPDGTPYGFARKVPEAEAGAALDAAAARSIAEERARTDWAVDFAPYKLLEQSQVQLPNGRIDHSFVYEREQEQLGDGRYRLRLGVAGDRLVEVTHSVHVPEAFERRFQEMRFANNAIAQVAGMSAGALYGIGGCILGVLWLLRRRALIWWPALVAGAVVAGLNALALVANAPQAWFGFDTAQPVWVFWGQQFALAVLVLVGGGLALGAGVHGGGKPVAPSVSAASAVVAPVVARGRAVGGGARPHGRGLSLGADRARADRRILFRHQPLLRLVAAVGIADRSQHPGQRACPRWRRSAWPCRRASWRNACFARCRCRSPRCSAIVSAIASCSSRSRWCCRRSSSARRTPTIRAFRRTRGWSSSSARRSSGDSSSFASGS